MIMKINKAKPTFRERSPQPTQAITAVHSEDTKPDAMGKGRGSGQKGGGSKENTNR
jgi:hypothetical protein